VGAVSSSASGAKKRKSASAGGVTYITNGGDAKLPRRLATQAGKQLCAHTHARSAERGGRAGQGRRDPYRITVAVHILPLSVPLRNSFKI